MVTAIVPQSPTAMAFPPIMPIGQIESIKEMAKVAAYSGFLNSNAAKNDVAQRSADAFFVMMLGMERGIPPMTALQQIYVIDGKPTASSQVLLGLMRKGGVQVQLPDPAKIATSATVRVKRPDSDIWEEFTYTLDMAKAAGLVSSYDQNGNVVGKNNWKKHWREMLVWRAVSTASRFAASDVVGGLCTIEEINPDIEVNEMGAPVGTISLPSAPRQGSQPDRKPIVDFPAPPAQSANAHNPPAENKSDSNVNSGQSDNTLNRTQPWYAEPKNLTYLADKARDAGYIEPTDGVEELLAITGEADWAFFPTGKDAWVRIENEVNNLRNQQPPQQPPSVSPIGEMASASGATAPVTTNAQVSNQSDQPVSTAIVEILYYDGKRLWFEVWHEEHERMQVSIWSRHQLAEMMQKTDCPTQFIERVKQLNAEQAPLDLVDPYELQYTVSQGGDGRYHGKLVSIRPFGASNNSQPANPPLWS